MNIEIPAIRWECIQLSGRPDSSASSKYFQQRRSDIYVVGFLPIGNSGDIHTYLGESLGSPIKSPGQEKKHPLMQKKKIFLLVTPSWIGSLLRGWHWQELPVFEEQEEL